MRFLRYLYYRIYIWNYKNWGASDQPQFNAMYGIMFLLALNLLTIVELCLAFKGIGLPSANKEIKMVLVIVIGVLFIIGYFIFIKNGRFHYIVAEFQHETKDERRRGTLKNVTYIVLSFLIPLVIAKFYHSLKIL